LLQTNIGLSKSARMSAAKSASPATKLGEKRVARIDGGSAQPINSNIIEPIEREREPLARNLRMPSEEKYTTPESLILEALAQYTLRSGYQLAVMTGLGPARLYPTLLRLENEGKIASEWEAMAAPRHRRYRLKESAHA
jgi:hypothetical protein